MRFETIAQDDFQIPSEHLCDGCGYEPVFSEQAKCEVCVKMDQFNRFASEINDVFGAIDRISRMINDAFMEVENEIYDDPALDIEAEKARIKAKVAKKIAGALTQLDLV